VLSNEKGTPILSPQRDEASPLGHSVLSTNLMLPSTIAIDGPAASGKSTLGELLAQRLGYFYFDSGIMYRAATWAALERGRAIGDEAAVTQLAETIRIDVLPATVEDGRQFTVTIDGQDVTWDLRRPEVDANVSPVSAYTGVRAAMTPQQRRIAERGRVIMAGRDIGTVVLPNADLKIYLDASVDERARRRMLEREAQGRPISFEEMRREIERRDIIDSTRAVAPLRRAPDAAYLDNTGLDIEGTVERALELINARDP
jgi:CMP/dCMP kinase